MRPKLTTNVCAETQEILNRFSELGCKSKGELIDRAVAQYEAVHGSAMRLMALADSNLIKKFPHVAVFFGEVAERALVHLKQVNAEDGFSELFEVKGDDV